MGDPYKGKVAGHALVWDGLPFPCCQCGVFVPDGITTKKAARAWHRQHKADKVDDFVANGIDDRGREVHL